MQGVRALVVAVTIAAAPAASAQELPGRDTAATILVTGPSRVGMVGPTNVEALLRGGEHRAARSVTDDFLASQPALEGAPWWAPLASAALPGAGQAALSQDRALAYLAVELYGWLRYASDIREARRERAGYRDLAARVARANLSESRPPGDFEYYERMEHYVESGVFDASAEDGVQPETDPNSYNGFIWLRARTTFWEDPTVPPPIGSDAHLAAMDYYSGRAIKPEFRWSWRNAQLEQDVFRRTISRSNEAFRRSIQDLGVLIANHALSTVDAYISIRVRSARTPSEGLAIEATLPMGGGRKPR